MITTKALTKKFNRLAAVDSVSLDVKKGEVFGLLGPNGAGKTTTLSMLSTILKPTSGEAFVNEYSIITQKDDVRKSIGIVFQDQSLDDELTAWENMDFHARLYRVPSDIRQKRALELLNLVGLAERKNSLVKTFSGGMKRRLELARGLLHHPKVLFLDEPTLGLDPQTRTLLWEYIEKLSREKNITVILTTHYMEEADKLCGRIAIIDHGKIIATGAPSELKERLGGDVITVESASSEKLKALLAKNKWFRSGKIHNQKLVMHVKDAGRHIAEIIKTADRNNIDISSVEMHEPTLEDVFLHYTGRKIRQEEADAKDAMRLRKKFRK
jgi:ABC-2 type transport system ATP-binding protein